MKIGALITAAGLSSRMGTFKPLLPYKDTTIIRHVIELLRKAGADPVIVVAGYRADEIRTHLEGLNVDIVENTEYANTQMFDSIKLGLRELAGRCDRVAFMPVDVPDISPELVRRIFEIEGKMVRPVYRGRPGHPVMLDASLIKDICEYQGERGLRGAMEATGYEIIEPEADDDGIYNDLDTPEDYRRLLQRIEGKKKSCGSNAGRTLYIVRHGAVEFPGGEKRCIGRTDLPLSDAGRKQAARLNEYFKDKNIQAVYCSSLSRAVETAQILAGREHEIHINDKLIELDVGEWENKPLKSLHKKLEDEAPGGEKRVDALKRFSDGVNAVLEETEGNVVIVSHAGVICSYLSERMNAPLETSRAIRQPYCGINRLAVSAKNETKLVEYGVKADKVPDKEEIIQMFQKNETPENVFRHCKIVAEGALYLARRLNSHGMQLDEQLIYVAALLHDVRRLQKKHADRGCELLLKEGYPQVADLIRQHHELDKLFLDEAAVVYYADKRYMGDKFVSLEERFQQSHIKNITSPEAELAHARRYKQARAVEEIINRKLGAERLVMVKG